MIVTGRVFGTSEISTHAQNTHTTSVGKTNTLPHRCPHMCSFPLIPPAQSHCLLAPQLLEVFPLNSLHNYLHTHTLTNQHPVHTCCSYVAMCASKHLEPCFAKNIRTVFTSYVWTVCFVWFDIKLVIWDVAQQRNKSSYFFNTLLFVMSLCIYWYILCALQGCS